MVSNEVGSKVDSCKGAVCTTAPDQGGQPCKA